MSDTPRREKVPLKDRLEALCIEMIDRGILFSEAVEQFEKCFITEVVTRKRPQPPARRRQTRHPPQHPLQAPGPIPAQNGCSRGSRARRRTLPPAYQTDSR